MKSLQLRIPPLLLVVLFASAMYGVAFLLNSLQFNFLYQNILAAFLLGVAVAIQLLGVAAFRKMKTSVDPLSPNKASSLVAMGIYRYSRNPMYLGMLCMLLAWLVFLGNPLNIFLVFGFWLYLTLYQIRPEEQVLAEKFKEKFTQYQGNVRRWI